MEKYILNRTFYIVFLALEPVQAGQRGHLANFHFRESRLSPIEVIEHMQVALVVDLSILLCLIKVFCCLSSFSLCFEVLFKEVMHILDSLFICTLRLLLTPTKSHKRI